MEKALFRAFILIVLLSVAFIGFWVWTDWNHGKSATQYIKDKTQKEEVVEETTNDDIVVEEENGEVEATVSINF